MASRINHCRRANTSQNCGGKHTTLDLQAQLPQVLNSPSSITEQQGGTPRLPPISHWGFWERSRLHKWVPGLDSLLLTSSPVPQATSAVTGFCGLWPSTGGSSTRGPCPPPSSRTRSHTLCLAEYLISSSSTAVHWSFSNLSIVCPLPVEPTKPLGGFCPQEAQSLMEHEVWRSWSRCMTLTMAANAWASVYINIYWKWTSTV